jgi:NADH:ubiquinone oxidoreductase subunit E
MIELCVCIGSSCHLKGAYNVIQAFQQLIEANSLHDRIDFKAKFCMKQCQNKGVSVSINDKEYNIVPEAAREFFESVVMPLIG